MCMDNLKHTQLPKKEDGSMLTPRDQLIYLSIKRDMDKDTLLSTTSMSLLSKRTGASIPTIRTSIRNLIKEGYLTIEKHGHSNYYRFNTYKNFEPFSDDFLDNPDLTYLEKSVLVASQQYMFIENHEGTMNYSNRELADKINISHDSINKCANSLEKKNYLTVCYDPNSTKQTKIFHLKEFGQAIVSTLKDHEDRITENSDKISALEKKVERLCNALEDKNKKIALQNEEIRRLKKIDKNNSLVIPADFFDE